MKDIPIARQLGVSPRTVTHRIRKLREGLAVETRFQAGFRLGRRFADEAVTGW